MNKKSGLRRLKSAGWAAICSLQLIKQMTKGNLFHKLVSYKIVLFLSFFFPKFYAMHKLSFIQRVSDAANSSSVSRSSKPKEANKWPICHANLLYHSRFIFGSVSTIQFLRILNKQCRILFFINCNLFWHPLSLSIFLYLSFTIRSICCCYFSFSNYLPQQLDFNGIAIASVSM